MYDFKVHSVSRVIDGDTFDLDVDCGFYIIIRIRVRLKGIDTPEIFGRNADLEKGHAARNAAAYWLHTNASNLRVRTHKPHWTVPIAGGGFGRWAGEVYESSGGVRLSDHLRHIGHEKDPNSGTVDP